MARCPRTARTRRLPARLSCISQPRPRPRPRFRSLRSRRSLSVPDLQQVRRSRLRRSARAIVRHHRSSWRSIPSAHPEHFARRWIPHRPRLPSRRPAGPHRNPTRRHRVRRPRSVARRQHEGPPVARQLRYAHHRSGRRIARYRVRANRRPQSDQHCVPSAGKPPPMASLPWSWWSRQSAQRVFARLSRCWTTTAMPDRTSAAPRPPSQEPRSPFAGCSVATRVPLRRRP